MKRQAGRPANLIRFMLAVATGILATLLAAPLVILAIPFALAGLATRALARVAAPRTLAWRELMRFEPTFGWAPKPEINGYASDLNGDPFKVTTDASGWRGRRPLEESDVVVFGDSFAFGSAIDDHRFFAEVDPQLAVKAIGAPGYNMVQSLELMRTFAAKLKGKLIVWFIYPGNDLDDNLRPCLGDYAAPFLRPAPENGEWTIERDHLGRRTWPFDLRRRNYETFVEICDPSSYLSQRVFSACEHLVRRAVRISETAGAKLVIVSIPDLSPLVVTQLRAAVAAAGNGEGFDPETADARIAEICARLGVRFIALRDHLDESHYRRNDVHWNAAGHRRVAALLRALWKESERGDRDSWSIDDLWRGRSFDMQHSTLDIRHPDDTVFAANRRLGTGQ